MTLYGTLYRLYHSRFANPNLSFIWNTLFLNLWNILVQIWNSLVQVQRIILLMISTNFIPVDRILHVSLTARSLHN